MVATVAKRNARKVERKSVELRYDARFSGWFMHASVMEFVSKVVQPLDVLGKHVLEVGSYNVNGSVRPLIEHFGPAKYIGTDMRDGPGVDQVVPADELVQTFDHYSFDLVVCAEVMEHVERWEPAINNMKAVLKIGGLLVLTTRSVGFPLHEYPGDYWRYSVNDLCRIFSDFDIQVAQPDPMVPGAFIAARRASDTLPTVPRMNIYRMPGQ